MLEVAQIDHIVLRTVRPQEMIEFYSNVLNCRVERDMGPELGLTQLRAGSSLIDIVAVDSKLGRAGGEAPAVNGNNLDHFCLQLSKISEEEIRNHLKKHGIEAPEFSERYGAEGHGQSVYIKDPDGNTVELRSQQG